jgi:hypothetical protein
MAANGKRRIAARCRYRMVGRPFDVYEKVVVPRLFPFAATGRSYNDFTVEISSAAMAWPSP